MPLRSFFWPEAGGGYWLHLPERWRRQPQTPVELNSNHFAVNAKTTFLCGTSFLNINSANFTSGHSDRGRWFGASFVGSPSANPPYWPSYEGWRSPRKLGITGNSSLTLWGRSRLMANAATDATGLIRVGYGGSNNAYFAFDIYQSVFYVDVWGSGWNSGYSPNNVGTQKWFDWALTFQAGASNGYRLYINKSRVDTGAAGPTALALIDDHLGTKSYVTQNKVDNEYVGVTNFAFTPSQVADVADAPYAVFRPLLKPRIFIPAAAGGGPVVVDCQVGVSTASGLAAAIDAQVTITASVGTSTASGLSAAIDEQVVIPASTAAATAAGLLATVDGQIIIPAGVASSAASGLASTITNLADRYGRPTSDVAVGPFAAVGAASIAAATNEESYSDAEYAEASAAGYFEVLLNGLIDPATSDGHTLSIRVPAGFAPDGALTFSLRQGTGTEIASRVESTPTADTTYAYELTSVEIDAITDYTDLRVRVALA